MLVAVTVLAFLLSLISSNIEWSLIALIGRCSVRHCLPPETFPWCRRCLARAPLHWGLSHISGDLVTSEDLFLGDSGTACSMCSGVFNGMLQFFLFSIISLKVCHLVVLLQCIWFAIKYWFVSVFNYYGCMIGAKLEVGCYF